ncbi:hypothetical protein [Myroides odoratus]|uniref:hypothetical protein n=1 Tax=Myroides odoratus TaxID=256 RepID=UPI0039B0A705
MVSNYENAEYRFKGLEEVCSNASKREREMRTEVSNLKLKFMGVSDVEVQQLNKMLGTDLKGVSKQEVIKIKGYGKDR